MKINIDKVFLSRNSLYSTMSDIECGKISRSSNLPIYLFLIDHSIDGEEGSNLIGKYLLDDGYHRFFEALLVGITEIECEIIGTGNRYMTSRSIPRDPFSVDFSQRYLGLEDLADTETLDDLKDKYLNQVSSEKLVKFFLEILESNNPKDLQEAYFDRVPKECIENCPEKIYKVLSFDSHSSFMSSFNLSKIPEESVDVTGEYGIHWSIDKEFVVTRSIGRVRVLLEFDLTEDFLYANLTMLSESLIESVQYLHEYSIIIKSKPISCKLTLL